MSQLFSWLSNAFTDIVNALLFLLPKSPFVYLDMVPEVKSVLGYVNYFIPLNTMVSILEMWLIAIGTYYLIQAGLRWAQIVD